MPTNKPFSVAKKPAISELKLDVSNNKSKISKFPTFLKKTSTTNANYRLCAANENASINTVSTQNLEFPLNENAVPAIKVPRTKLGSLEGIASKTPSTAEKRGYNINSTSNSNYAGWVFPSRNRIKRKCSTTPTELSTPTASSSLKTLKNEDHKETIGSQEMTDSKHEASAKRMPLNGAQWKKPCKGSYVAGAPKGYIGTCPPNFEELAKMSKARQKFFLTQDPRKKYCLRNPDVLHQKTYTKKMEFNALTKMVNHAQNTCVGTESNSSASFICDVVDLENPMELDFQGMDYKNTYERDELNFENQRLYRRIGRYMDRKRVRAETATIVENQLQEERLDVPQCFEVPNRNVDASSTTTQESLRYSKLYRAADKPFNQQRIVEELARRRERYREMYMLKTAKAEREKKERQQKEQEAKDLKAANLALRNFNDVNENINKSIEHSFKKKILPKKEIKQRIFPHTLHETDKFKGKLKIENRIKRDEALVKKEFFLERLGLDKNYPEANLEISSDSFKYTDGSKSHSEQSSDDQDDINVGKTTDTFKLRGFHFKLGDNLRGKTHQREVLKDAHTKGCITREEWLKKLAPKKEAIKPDLELGIEKFKNPDDPELMLFHPEFDYKPPKAKVSAVRQYLQRRLGRHYDAIMRKKELRLVKPRLKYTVKKFNLISFLYGETAKNMRSKKGRGSQKEINLTDFNTTLEYIEQKDQLKKQRKNLLKHERLKLMGIPCKEVKKSLLLTQCENSESDSASDWAPEAGPDMNIHGDEIYNSSQPKVPLRMRGNMPAPKYRESTLRRNPRNPRDYAGQRVPAQLFDEAVKTTGLPHLHELAPDIIKYANVRQKKRPYTDMFNARHHHDHWDPTQQKQVGVHYQAEIVAPHVTNAKSKLDNVIMENYCMAHPPCNEFVDMDLTMPQLNSESMIADHLMNSKRNIDDIKSQRTTDNCNQADFIYHSRTTEPPNFPGHREFLDFLQEIRDSLNENKPVEEGQVPLLVDREALIKELEEDLKSIESCLTSLDSSECTNISNDSGSFILMEGKTKVPMDYIRKSLIPFEELQRARFKIEPINVDAEDANPFRMVPFSGQKKEQLELIQKDAFFTFSTRLNNSLRLRLEVPIEDVRKTLIGHGAKKYPGLVSTDIDENYVDELKNRPAVKLFNFISGRSLIKDALRLKFESMMIQGQIVRTKIYDRMNDLHWENMLKTKLLYEKLFAKWEKREYEAAMSVVYKVKTYYEMTDTLKVEHRDLARQQKILNMDIVFIEGHWIQRIMLQNFHYLIGDQVWRYENDWIHRIEGDENNELESFGLSIAKRSVVNIRTRDKDDAWAIKAFYEDVYLKNLHPILLVYPDAESFLRGIENLKAKTFVSLLELHFTLSIHTELQGRLKTLEQWCIEDLKMKTEYVARKCSKQYFMDDRAQYMKRRTLDFIDEPIEKSFNDDTFNKDRAVVAEVWRQIVPANLRGSSDQEPEPIDMVAMMSDVVVELIGKFEVIITESSREVEQRLRRTLAYQRKLSRQATLVEKRIEMEMKKVNKNLEPPYVRPKPTGKLPRYYLKKKEKKVVAQEKRITEHRKFFFRAFHDEGAVMKLGDTRDSIYVVDTIQEHIVPFYFDHFLKLNGYTPNYNFKTQVELRDGPELGLLQVKSLVPEVQEKIDKWESNRKRQMEDNIARNPKMYENVNF